jgi:hypothetical protein
VVNACTFALCCAGNPEAIVSLVRLDLEWVWKLHIQRTTYGQSILDHRNTYEREHSHTPHHLCLSLVAYIELVKHARTSLLTDTAFKHLQLLHIVELSALRDKV